jgi:amino acid transporter
MAILMLAAIVSILAFSGDISELASATSLLLLLVFALMNTALIVLRLRKGEPAGRFEVPVFVPLLGCLICAALIVSRVATAAAGTRAPLIAAILLAAIAVLYFVVRPREPLPVAD